MKQMCDSNIQKDSETLILSVDTATNHLKSEKHYLMMQD